MRQLLFCHPFLFLMCWSCACGADAPHSDAGISELLARSVPAADWEEVLSQRQRSGWVRPRLPSLVPEDSGDVSKLLRYWEVSYEKHTDSPSPAVRARLLTCCEEDPEVFEKVSLWFEPAQDETVQRIMKLHARLPGGTEDEKKIQATVRHWLMTEAGKFRDELRAEAESFFHTPDDARRKACFEALQRLEPGVAAEMLLQHANDASPAARCAALVRLHAAQADNWRAELQKLVTSDAPPLIRVSALKELAKAEWPGRTEWILGLFSDAALGVVSQEFQQEEPLAAIIGEQPDFWVPKIIPLVGNKNRVVHDNAVRCLVQFHLENKREDALRPLLPWLSDPRWALEGEGYGRLRVLQTLDDMNLPESVPGLLWAAEHDSDAWLAAAASALVHYKATQAVPLLRKALDREADGHYRNDVVAALFDLGGVPMEEQAAAIESYAADTLTKEGQEALSNTAMPPLLPDKPQSSAAEELRRALGLMLLRSWRPHSEALTQALTQALIQRMGELRVEKPNLAAAIEDEVSLWDTPSSITLVMDRLRTGRFTAQWVAALLDENHLPHASLEALTNLPGRSAAIVATLLNDEKRMHGILAGNEPVTQAMLLACVRLQRKPLPLAEAARLLDSKNILCARAADRYLEAEDSKEARALLLRRFQGEARILGARMSHDPGHFSYGSMSKTENLLRERVLTSKTPLAIYALISAGYWGDNGQAWIEVQNDRAALVNEQGGGRFRTRDLTAKEFAGLKQYIAQNQVDELPPLTLEVNDGIQYEYVSLTSAGGRRVFMNNPGSYRHINAEESDKDSVYVCLVDLFHKLMEDQSRLSVHYSAAAQIKGLNIIVPREQANVRTVMVHHGQLIMYAELPGHDKPRWMLMKDGERSKSVTDAPVLTRPNGGFSEDFRVSDHWLNADWLTAFDGGYARPANRKRDDLDGLWLCRSGREPELLAEGVYSSPIASADGRWIVAAHVLGESWAQPNDVVRINAVTRLVTPLKLLPADNFNPVTRLPQSGKILVHRVRDASVPGVEPDQGPEKNEYHLLDPATGELERVFGEFGPLRDESWRPLQPASQPGVVWAAVPTYEHEEPKAMKIGRYDMRTFAFSEVMEIPGMYFTSMDFWVDEDARAVFLAVNGDLLSFPLPASADKKNR
jgi:hypothetical protein